MVALACDFHVLASRVTTGFTAVLFSVRHITHARYVGTLFGLLIRHFDYVLSGSILRTPRLIACRSPKPRIALDTDFPGVLRLPATLDEVISVGRLISCRHLDDHEVASFDRSEYPSKFEDTTLSREWIYLCVCSRPAPY
jgi:hypothetical protein